MDSRTRLVSGTSAVGMSHESIFAINLTILQIAKLGFEMVICAQLQCRFSTANV